MTQIWNLYNRSTTGSMYNVLSYVTVSQRDCGAVSLGCDLAICCPLSIRVWLVCMYNHITYWNSIECTWVMFQYSTFMFFNIMNVGRCRLLTDLWVLKTCWKRLHKDLHCPPDPVWVTNLNSLAARFCSTIGCRTDNLFPFQSNMSKEEVCLCQCLCQRAVPVTWVCVYFPGNVFNGGYIILVILLKPVAGSSYSNKSVLQSHENLYTLLHRKPLMNGW